MANVKFAYGSTTPTTSTSGFDDGCLYFNYSTKVIHFRVGNIVYAFDGNNSTGFVDSNKMNLVKSATLEVTNPGSIAVNGLTNTATVTGIVTGYKSTGSGSSHSLSTDVTTASGNISTKITASANFSTKGTATFTYYYIPTT